MRKAAHLRVAMVSCKNLPGRAAANLENHLRWADRALARGARFVGFPECSLTGYALRRGVALALDDRPVREMVRFAESNRAYVSFGLVERRRGRFCNSQVMAGPRGVLGVMRKINLTRTERTFFSGGRELPVFAVGAARVGIAICADATHFETPHTLALRGATVIFCPHATYLEHTPQSWLKWRLARWPLFARDCAAWFIGCNNAGLFERSRLDEADLRFASGALAIDPDGRVTARSAIRRNRETMVVADVTLAGIARRRAEHFAFTQLRTDVFYRGMTLAGPQTNGTGKTT